MRFDFYVPICCLMLACGCGDSESVVPAPARPAKVYTVEYPAAVQALLAKARTAEPQIQVVRQQRFEVSDRDSIPVGPKALTDKEFAKQISTYRLLELQLYQSRSRDRPEVKAIVEQMLREVCVNITAEDTERSTAKILSLYSAAAQLGTDEPMVEVYGLAYRPVPDDDEGRRVLRERLRAARQRIPKDDHGLYYDCLLARRQVEANQYHGTVLKRERPDVDIVDRKELASALVRHLERHPMPEHWRCAHWLFTRYAQHLQESHRETMLQDLVRSSEVVDWYKCLQAVELLSVDAKNIRGNGQVEMSEDSLRAYREKNEQIRTLLIYAWSLKPDAPEASSQLIYYAAKHHNSEWNARQWFNQVVDSQVDYLPAYQNLIQRLRANQGGGPYELIGFARECVANGRLELGVPTQGMFALWTLWEDIGVTQSLVANPAAKAVVTAYASQVLKAVAEKRPIHSDGARYSDVVLRWLIESEEYQLASDRHHNSGYTFSVDSSDSSYGRISRDRWILAACLGPAADIARPLVQVIYGRGIPTAGDLSKLRQQCSDLKSRDSSDATQLLCHEMESVITTWETFESGEWTELEFDKDFVGWRCVAADEVVAVDASTIQMRSAHQAFATHLARFRPPYMVDVEFHPYRKDEAKTSQSQLMTGLVGMASSFDPHALLYVSVSNNRRSIHLHTEMDEHLTGFGDRDVMPVRLKIWPDVVESTFLGVRSKALAMFRPPSPTVSIGATLHDASPKAMQFHKLRVRKIPYEARSMVPSSQLVAYGKQIIEFDPEDPDGYLALHTGYANDGSHEEALSALRMGVSRVSHSIELKLLLASEYFLQDQFLEAYEILRKVPDFEEWSPLELAMMTEIVALSDDESIRNPRSALDRTRLLHPDRYWLAARAVAMAQAANGDFVSARKNNQLAIDLAPKEAQKLLHERAALLERGEVPVLKMKKTPVPMTEAEPKSL